MTSITRLATSRSVGSRALSNFSKVRQILLVGELATTKSVISVLGVLVEIESVQNVAVPYETQHLFPVAFLGNR
jgi:hypothetical protein